jgi:hypothetical protein
MTAISHHAGNAPRLTFTVIEWVSATTFRTTHKPQQAMGKAALPDGKSVEACGHDVNCRSMSGAPSAPEVARSDDGIGPSTGSLKRSVKRLARHDGYVAPTSAGGWRLAAGGWPT